MVAGSSDKVFKSRVKCHLCTRWAVQNGSFMEFLYFFPFQILMWMLGVSCGISGKPFKKIIQDCIGHRVVGGLWKKAM